MNVQVFIEITEISAIMITLPVEITITGDHVIDYNKLLITVIPTLVQTSR